jgi:hypothetical protein
MKVFPKPAQLIKKRCEELMYVSFAAYKEAMLN